MHRTVKATALLAFGVIVSSGCAQVQYTMQEGGAATVGACNASSSFSIVPAASVAFAGGIKYDENCLQHVESMKMLKAQKADPKLAKKLASVISPKS